MPQLPPLLLGEHRRELLRELPRQVDAAQRAAELPLPPVQNALSRHRPVRAPVARPDEESRALLVRGRHLTCQKGGPHEPRQQLRRRLPLVLARPLQAQLERVPRVAPEYSRDVRPPRHLPLFTKPEPAVRRDDVEQPLLAVQKEPPDVLLPDPP